MPVSGHDVVAYAQQFLGVMYKWGGNDLSTGVDCSGLVQQVLKNFGISVPRTTYDQIGVGKGVKMNELQVGDLVFFDNNSEKAGPDHVGFYIGDGKMINAPSPGKPIRIERIDDGYWGKFFMGGRRVSGITGGEPSGDWEPGDNNPTPKLDPEAMAAEYGWAYSFLKSIPSVNSLFEQMVSETWTKEKFQAELRNTDWWKQNSETVRQAQQEKATDPATYSAKIEAAKIQIQQLAAEMGAVIPGGKLSKFAEQAIQTGLDEALLRNLLGQYVTFTEKGTMTGQAGMLERQMKEYAYEQGVSLDKQTIKNQAQLVARGLATQDDFKNQIVAQASSAYPAYVEQLKGGQTMRQIAAPYIQQMADDLEIADTSISLTDPLIKRALNGLNKDGKPMGMQLVDFQSTLRSDPRWRRTSKAQQATMNVGIQVLRDMGMIGGR